jgi:hypothetical protein
MYPNSNFWFENVPCGNPAHQGHKNRPQYHNILSFKCHVHTYVSFQCRPARLRFLKMWSEYSDYIEEEITSVNFTVLQDR